MTDSTTTRREFLRGLGYTAAAAALLDTATALEPRRAKAAPPGSLSNFGRLFPNLPPFQPDPNPNTTVQNLTTLANTMGTPINVPNPNGAGAIYTYWGQFIDHDMTRDLEPLPFDPTSGGIQFVDPTKLQNVESFRFDLSSLYNTNPPGGTGAIFNGIRFITQEPNPNGIPDLPRNSQGVALIGDPRNDENQLIAQIHHAFLRFHNAVVDALNLTDLQTARDTVSQYFQWAVLNDFLPTICGPDLVTGILNGSIDNPARHGHVNAPDTPIEWSTSAYRLHCMPRTGYAVNNGPGGGHPLFNGTDNDLHGGRNIPANARIDFGNFTAGKLASLNPPAKPQLFNEFRAVLVGPNTPAAALFNLPIGGPAGAEPAGTSVLALRNLLRGFGYGDPSGQDVAKALGQTVISPTDMIDPNQVPGFTAGTPLWFYLLKEAELQAASKTVGPSAGRIIAGSFIRVMQDDKNGILHGGGKKFVPQPPIAPKAGQFDLTDLLVFAGVASRP